MHTSNNKLDGVSKITADQYLVEMGEYAILVCQDKWCGTKYLKMVANGSPHMQLENMTTEKKESQYGTVQEFAHFLPSKIEKHKV